MPKNFEKLKDLFKTLNEGLTKQEFLDAFQQITKIVVATQNKVLGDSTQNKKDFEDFKSQINAAQGATLKDIMAGAKDAVANAIILMGQDADNRLAAIETKAGLLTNGKDADEQAILERLKENLPSPEELMQNLPVMAPRVRDALELLQGDDRLDISAIRGVDNLKKELADAMKTGKPIQIRGGATRGFFLYIGGVKKGIMNTINFAPGTGMSIAYSKVNGLDTLTFNASASSGITVETPPEACDASNVLFTVSAQPKWIVADGTTYYEGAGYSYAAGQVTLDVAPSSFIRAII